MQHIVEAFHLFRTHPRLWRYAIAPLGWSAALFLAIVLIGFVVFVPMLTRAFAELGLGEWSNRLGVLAYVLVWLFASGIVFLGIASLLSSLMWDKLSAEIEALLGGRMYAQTFTRAELVRDSMARALLSLSLAALAFCCGLVVPIVGPLVIAGYVALLDFTAAPMSRRGDLLPQQRPKVMRLNHATSFGLVAGALTLLPLVNVLMLPVLAAAGTVMVVRSEPSQ